VINQKKADPERAAALIKEIDAQKLKLQDAPAEADRYSGGLVQAMALMTVVTITNTIASLEQQHTTAKYGLAVPSAASAVAAAQRTTASSTTATRAASKNDPKGAVEKPNDCLKIDTFDSSVLQTNDTYTELASKV
jgi:hypothetical protein